ncbi:stress protein [Rothia uropygialis]|uniref:stress protein n=1 Tax=Kocuria sp. 36 TaxID=1415402 RepID=UPI00101CFEFB|nr:stress protein [Kocuria sp. 36]
MADKNNPGLFGNREDTKEQAHKGGEQSAGSFGSKTTADPRGAGRESTGSFGAQNSADPHETGGEGAAAQSTEDKAKGGRHSGNQSG